MVRVFNIVTVANVHSLLFSVGDIVSMHQFLCTHCSRENILLNVLYSQYTVIVEILSFVYSGVLGTVYIICGHNIIAVGGGGGPRVVQMLIVRAR